MKNIIHVQMFLGTLKLMSDVLHTNLIKQEV